MKNAEGRGVICVGDRTSHGGYVLTGSAEFKVLGKNVACDGDMTVCPKCRGNFAIRVGTSDREHHEKRVASGDDRTVCGAILISSL